MTKPNGTRARVAPRALRGLSDVRGRGGQEQQRPALSPRVLPPAHLRGEDPGLLLPPAQRHSRATAGTARVGAPEHVTREAGPGPEAGAGRGGRGGLKERRRQTFVFADVYCGQRKGRGRGATRASGGRPGQGWDGRCLTAGSGRLVCGAVPAWARFGLRRGAELAARSSGERAPGRVLQHLPLRLQLTP